MTKENTRKGKCRRINEPTVNGRPRMQVIRLEGGQMLDGWCLCKHPWGFLIHWDHILRRSERCDEDKEKCPGCQVKKPQKQVFYLHMHSPKKGHFYVEMTPECCRMLLDQMPAGDNLRGYRLEFSRTKANNGRLYGEILWQHARRNDLPGPVDPEGTLQYLWEWGRV